jgi:hypothetical protein
LAKIGRQLLVSPWTRECGLKVSISATLEGHGDKKDKKSTRDSWERVPRENRGVAGRQARVCVRK